MNETQQYEKLVENPSRTNFIVYASLMIGLIILVVCQIFLFRATARQQIGAETKNAEDVPPRLVASTAVSSSVIQFVSCADDDLADAVAAVRPAVVNIDVAPLDVGSSGRRGGPALSFDIPPSEALKASEETLGSGVIVHSDGYVVTCYHIIRDYPKVYVTVFGAGRRTYDADLVAVDMANDLALLRIWPDSPMPSAKMANSDMVKVTDTVLAIGSPFGFEHTVTAGIVGDRKRSVVIDGRTYVDLLQTDVAINRGSAGGALINAEGEVIGINTAIASEAEYFSGISFAVPINRARPLLLEGTGG